MSWEYDTISKSCVCIMITIFSMNFHSYAYIIFRTMENKESSIVTEAETEAQICKWLALIHKDIDRSETNKFPTFF